MVRSAVGASVVERRRRNPGATGRMAGGSPTGELGSRPVSAGRHRGLNPGSGSLPPSPGRRLARGSQGRRWAFFFFFFPLLFLGVEVGESSPPSISLSESGRCSHSQTSSSQQARECAVTGGGGFGRRKGRPGIFQGGYCGGFRHKPFLLNVLSAFVLFPIF